MKGYIYTLEALIAISLILTSLIFLFGTAPTQPELEISIIKQQGFEALEYLDNRDFMRNHVEKGLRVVMTAKAAAGIR